MKKIHYWSPRILSILYIIFINLFTLDVFSQKNWLPALFMHLIPSFILIILTIIAWKYSRIGGFLFIIAGIAAVIFFHASLVTLPIFIIGLLFLSLHI